MRIKNLSLAAVLSLTFMVPQTIRAEEKPAEETTRTPAEETGKKDIPAEKATPEAEAEKTGTIRIQLAEAEKRSRENVEFTIVKVADIADGQYKLLPRFEGTGVNLNLLLTTADLQDAAEEFTDFIQDTNEDTAKKVKKDAAAQTPDKNSQTLKQDSLNLLAQADEKAKAELENLAEKSRGQSFELKLKTDKDGEAFAESLPVGVYLVYADDIAGYELIEPALVAVPHWDEETRSMQYDADLTPKHSDLPELEILKTDAKTNKAITGKTFTFTAYADADCKTKMQTGETSKAAGTSSFPVSYGTMYIKETSAPEGYLLSDEVVVIRFDQDEKLYINSMEVQPEKDNVYQVVYKNYKESKVPPAEEQKNPPADKDNPSSNGNPSLNGNPATSGSPVNTGIGTHLAEITGAALMFAGGGMYAAGRRRKLNRSKDSESNE